jgi:hypothetical protein
MQQRLYDTHLRTAGGAPTVEKKIEKRAMKNDEALQLRRIKSSGAHKSNAVFTRNGRIQSKTIRLWSDLNSIRSCGTRRRAEWFDPNSLPHDKFNRYGTIPNRRFKIARRIHL